MAPASARPAAKIRTDPRNAGPGHRLLCRRSTARHQPAVPIHPAMRLRRGGFTLLELLLTLVIFAAIAAIALPGASILLADRKVVRGGDQLQAEMIRTRVSAMRNGRVMIIEAAVGGNVFRVRPFFSAADAVQANDVPVVPSALVSGADQASNLAIDAGAIQSRQFEVDPTLSVTSVQVASAARGLDVIQSSDFYNIPTSSQASSGQDSPEQVRQWSQPILFYPDGTTSTATVTLAEDTIGSVTVGLRGVTGDVTVTEVGT